MQFLRRSSTRQLFVLFAAVLAIVAAGTALAIAASSGGPVPPRKPLANAVRGALVAPEPQGVTARVSFTNGLLGGIDLRGSNPILAGATGRLWATADGRFRLELQAARGSDSQAVSDGKTLWLYDGSSNTLYTGSVPQDHAQKRAAAPDRVPTLARIQKVLGRVMQQASITGPTPGNVAGEPAYTVRIAPKRDGGLLGALELAWDAGHGTPLRGAVYARGESNPVLELKATEISFGPVDGGVFNFSTPAGAKTVKLASHGREARGAHKRGSKPAMGLAAVQRRVAFRLSAPHALAGRSRTTVAPLGKQRGHGGALVTYGRGLAGLAVIEQPAPAAADRGPLAHAQLPTVSVNGASGQELSTPLGTVVRFTRGGVSYTVLASAPRAVVEAAARGL